MHFRRIPVLGCSGTGHCRRAFNYVRCVIDYRFGTAVLVCCGRNHLRRTGNYVHRTCNCFLRKTVYGCCGSNRLHSACRRVRCIGVFFSRAGKPLHGACVSGPGSRGAFHGVSANRRGGRLIFRRACISRCRVSDSLRCANNYFRHTCNCFPYTCIHLNGHCDQSTHALRMATGLHTLTPRLLSERTRK